VKAELPGPDGGVVVHYAPATTGSVRWALDAELAPGTTPGEAADALVRELPGHRVSTTDDRLVEALVARRGTIQRRAHDYGYDTATADPAWLDLKPPAGYAVEPMTDPGLLQPVCDRAYPAGHVDFESHRSFPDGLRQIATGTVVGPLLTGACLQVRTGTALVGAIVVTDRPPFGARQRRVAWVTELFVDPAHAGRGLGTLLLRRALAATAAAGLDRAGLVVTDRNPARRRYEQVGFTLVASGTNVDLPV
jgi:GNAT superfamily N-acetyltransferase